MNYLPSIGIRFNEREFSHYASTPTAREREGFLQKKGEGNTSFKQRYFILKANFLFYFKGPRVLSPFLPTTTSPSSSSSSSFLLLFFLLLLFLPSFLPSFIPPSLISSPYFD